MKPTLTSSIKQSIQQRGKGRTKRERTQVLATRAQPKMGPTKEA